MSLVPTKFKPKLYHENSFDWYVEWNKKNNRCILLLLIKVQTNDMEREVEIVLLFNNKEKITPSMQYKNRKTLIPSECC